uniref:Uncharacterized protein n=1 Tax=Rhizophora mucronata TaxID=61149 RepID=A0A2P2J331_RHIMU
MRRSCIPSWDSTVRTIFRLQNTQNAC